MNKVLYIYGYGSSPDDSSTMKVMKKIMCDLGYELFSIEYDQENPDLALDKFENYILKNDIKYVIGHSLGGFITLCLDSNVKKLVINPTLKPHLDLPNIGDLSEEAIYDYEYLEHWLRSGDDTPWVNCFDEVMGLFGDKDELFNYYESFKKRYPSSYRINSTHRPTEESFTEDIKKKIKEFFD